MRVTSTELIHIQDAFRRRIQQSWQKSGAESPVLIKVHHTNAKWIPSHPTRSVRWVTKVPFGKAKTSQRWKYAAALKRVTATKAFLEICFLTLQLTLWLGTILKAQKYQEHFFSAQKTLWGGNNNQNPTALSQNLWIQHSKRAEGGGEITFSA